MLAEAYKFYFWQLNTLNLLIRQRLDDIIIYNASLFMLVYFVSLSTLFTLMDSYPPHGNDHDPHYSTVSPSLFLLNTSPSVHPTQTLVITNTSHPISCCHTTSTSHPFSYFHATSPHRLTSLHQQHRPFNPDLIHPHQPPRNGFFNTYTELSKCATAKKTKG